ncbi:MAG: hypothetical protein K6B72_00495 [Lachnospiraceae bacterium]|nr:hypothetical protein [Lachnospiraceae bacterium]
MAIFMILAMLFIAACGSDDFGKSENKSDKKDKSEMSKDKDDEDNDKKAASVDDEFILDGPPNYDLPHVDPHDGVFTNEHGKMTFNGDGNSVSVEIDSEIEQYTGLPAGKYDAEYFFYNPIEPAGYRCEYNEAHEMHFIVDGKNFVVDVGMVRDNGTRFTTGVDCTTADMITLQGDDLKHYYEFRLIK